MPMAGCACLERRAPVSEKIKHHEISIINILYTALATLLFDGFRTVITLFPGEAEKGQERTR